MPQFSQEVWTAIGIISALLLGGIVGKVWRPLRQIIAAVDVVAGLRDIADADSEDIAGAVCDGNPLRLASLQD